LRRDSKRETYTDQQSSTIHEQ